MMNEKLKDLAFKAGFVGESMFPIVGTCQETALQNFAELLIDEVKEIIKARMFPNLKDYDSNIVHNCALQRVVYDINDRFLHVE